MFQDFKLFAFTLKENIAFENAEQVSDEVLLEVLRKSGLSSKVDELAQGMNTAIYKIFDENGTEFSGGQSQKLAIARAMCRESNLVILDEPTSALDPYAEHDIYLKFNEMIDGKTAVYISHRLSSCKFYDKIAVFDHGKIVEYGSHRELLTMKCGK